MRTFQTKLYLVLCGYATAFTVPGRKSPFATRCYSTASEVERSNEKDSLLRLIGRSSRQNEGVTDPVLADPFTKQPLRVTKNGGAMVGFKGTRVRYDMKSLTNSFAGSSDTFINLLEPVSIDLSGHDTSSIPRQIVADAIRNLNVFVPPPVRSVLPSFGQEDYVPMRDLFTLPSVAIAYERGWRQGFAQAGFPGADREFEMAKEYFAPAVATSSTVVDMSCATGLFTRRFARDDTYDRVLGCDYSESMLTEARRRINADRKLSKGLKKTQLELVRLDVGMIPMQNETVDVLHAGAAMHCWPELEKAVKEIFRVLKPGGRYFATTFLSQYFRALRITSGAQGPNQPSKGAYQYFVDTDQLKILMEIGGFESDKIQIEVLGAACVIIRCEK